MSTLPEVPKNSSSVREGLRMQYRWRLFIFFAGFLIALGLAKLSDRLGMRPAVGEAVVLTFLFGFLYYDFQTWRCPGCDAFLGLSRSIFLIPDACKKCGRRLEE
jgi:hypothetical protein